jgi:hypothetical protein
MNTLFLARQATRNLKQRQLGDLPADDALIVVNALNTALEEVYSKIPSKERRSPDSKDIREPSTAQVDIVNGAKGFAWQIGPPTPYSNVTDLLGHSVTLGADPKVNRLHRSTELLQPYYGPNGVITATFYGDAIGFGPDEIHLTGNPHWTELGQAHARELRLLDDPRRLWTHYPFLNTVTTGSPEYWWTEPLLAAERSSRPVWLLRVWPLPAVRGSLSYELEFRSPVLTLEDLTIPRDLGIAQHHLSDILNLADAELIGTPLWAPDSESKDVATKAARSLSRLENRPRPLHTQPLRIRTPKGW